jgi:hypothetical protein
VLAVGTALAGLCYCLAGISSGFPLLVLALLLGGIGAATQHPIARSGSFAIGLRFSEMAEATDMYVDVARGTLLSPLPREAKSYFGAFGIAAVVVYRDGRVGMSRDPAGCVAAWWVEADQAGGRQARTQNCCDIPAVYQAQRAQHLTHAT